jgi:transcriptional regulator with XRE-family HTH domain
MEYGQLILRARERHGITQRELAERLGVNASTVSLWESETKVPGFQVRAKLADILDIPRDEMLPEVHRTPARTVYISETKLIQAVDIFRELPPTIQDSLLLTLQMLQSAGNFRPEARSS